MITTINAPRTDQQQLNVFWSRYFTEIPTCSVSGCERIAVAVDAFFPYLDDHNRCDEHRAEDHHDLSASLA